MYNHPAVFRLELRLLPTILCRGCRIGTAINNGKLLFHWCGGQGVKTARGFWVWRTDIPRFREAPSCTSVLAPLQTLTDIILHVNSRIFPSWSSRCPTCWKKWRAVQKSMISSWRCWSYLTWMLKSFWVNKLDVPISWLSRCFISSSVGIDLLSFHIWHHVMSCC